MEMTSSSVKPQDAAFQQATSVTASMTALITRTNTTAVSHIYFTFVSLRILALIHDLLFLPISTIESRVS